MSIQPTADSLKGARVQRKFTELVALGRAVENCERQAIPLDHATLHQMADQWLASPLTETEQWVIERIGK
jgi:hypothetical protein